MSVPSIILTIGVDNSKSEDVIKLIITDDDITNISNGENTRIYNWRISNKYYVADVQFHLLDKKTDSIENIINSVEAIIIYIDHLRDSFLKELDEWNIILGDISTDAKILIFKHFIPKDQKCAVQKWCYKNEYEFIELELNEKLGENSTSEDEEIFGIDRAIEILHTHQWSNLHLRKKNTFENTEHVEPACTTLKSNLATSTSSKEEKEPDNSRSSMTDDKQLDNMEELFDLFQNLQSMKLNISSLSGSDKLDQAEKVVKAFWNGIGGDMNEFDESDDEIT